MSNLKTRDETDEKDREEDSEVGYCPQCGVWNDDLTLGCSNCGYPRVDADEAESTNY